MKYFAAVVIVLAALAGTVSADPNAPASQDAATLWVSGSDLAYQNTDISVWLGYRHENIEAGIAAEYRMFSEGDISPDDQSALALGIYGAYHFPGLVDVNNPIPIEWLPEKLLAEPFVDLAYLLDVDGKGTKFAPGVGIRIFDIFALKYDYAFFNGVAAKDEGRIGLSFKLDF